MCDFKKKIAPCLFVCLFVYLFLLPSRKCKRRWTEEDNSWITFQYQGLETTEQEVNIAGNYVGESENEFGTLTYLTLTFSAHFFGLPFPF